jgi:U3 small nucleolar RNA-associated protein 7
VTELFVEMDALVAKAQVLDKSRKRKRSYYSPNSKSKDKYKGQDGILASVVGRTGLPASLASASASVLASESSNSHKHIKDRKLRAQLLSQSTHARLTKSLNAEVEDPLFDITNELEDSEAGVNTVGVGIVVEGDLERTWRVSQDEIVKSVGGEAGKLRREVKLDGGPYRVRYTRNGR